MQRRTFVQALGASVAGGPLLRVSATDKPRPLARIGLELYSIRDAMRADPEAAMLLEKFFGPYTRRFLDALEQVTPQLPPMARAVRFAMARDVVDASFANDMLPAWLARRVGAQPTPDELADLVTDFLVAAFEAPA